MMSTDLLRRFDEVCNTGVAIAGYTSGLCGEWTEERFECFAAQLDTECSKMIMANQRHTDKVSVMGTLDAGYGVIRPHDDNYSDAMITAQTGLMLCVHTADCVPVVLLDLGEAVTFWPLKNKENINKVLKDKILTMYTSIKCKIWLFFKII